MFICTDTEVLILSKYKYPYIPKEYYSAVMFACKMIRENGYFNKAIKAAAKYYDVDETTLEKHVRARQGAGQKGSTRKYYYFVLFCVKDYQQMDDCGSFNSWYYTEEDYRKYSYVAIKKATTEDNAKRALQNLSKDYLYHGGECDTIFKAEKYDTEQQAKDRQDSIKTWEQFKKAAGLKFEDGRKINYE